MLSVLVKALFPSDANYHTPYDNFYAVILFAPNESFVVESFYIDCKRVLTQLEIQVLQYQGYTTR